MLQRIVLLVAVVVLSAGCATTSPGSSQSLSLLQVRVGELERGLESKDEEVQELKYQVKDLTYEIDRLKTKVPGYTAAVKSRSTQKGLAQIEGIVKTDGEIIRVNVDPKDVQQALKNSGHYSGNIDGKVGLQTKKAIAAFQKDNGLTSDGLVGRQTWIELKTYLD